METRAGEIELNEHRRILVVDDEPQITRVLRYGLQSHRYEVKAAAEGEEALAAFRTWKPELIVTDLVMPNLNGIELCRRLRAISLVPIIVLSARGDEHLKVEALDAGADDYVTKPFGMEELLARVRVILRRPQVLAKPEEKSIEVGDFRVDLRSRKVSVRKKYIHLTPKEYDLLLYLLQHPNKILTHYALLGAIWGGDYVEQTEYLRVFIGQLRKKIEPDLPTPRYILTEPWTGYRFDPGE